MVPKLISKAAERSPSDLLREMSRWYLVAHAIHVAAELGVADALGAEAATAEELARGADAHPGALLRLLRLLASYGIFEETADGRFRNSALSEALREGHPQSVRQTVRRADASWWKAFSDTLYSVRTGRSAFPHANGEGFFEYLARHPERQAAFDAGMAQASRAQDAVIAAAYDFSRFERITEIGGGRGGLIAEILRRAPKAEGILYDQPQVVANPTYLAEAGLLDRCARLGGDFFASVPAGADCYVIKNVLHDFSDEQCAVLLRHCRAGLRPGGRLLSIDRFLPPSAEGPHETFLIDLQMLVLLHGKERTEAEWQPLFAAAGFAIARIIPTPIGFAIIEARPA